MLFMRICVITYYRKVVVGPGEHLCTLLEVWVLGVGMSTLDAQTVLYTEDRGHQVPMTRELTTLWGLNFVTHRPVPHRTWLPLYRDSTVRQGFQIGTFRPIRVDHTDFFQVTSKTHSFSSSSWPGCVTWCWEMLSYSFPTQSHLGPTYLQ